MSKNEKKQPYKKVSAGRISLTVWKQKRLMCSGSENSTGYVEQMVEFERVCVQHSVKNKQTGEWMNQQLWLNVEELRDLAKALDELNEAGDDSPAPSEALQWSVRVHHIVEYIKANSLDAGFDVFDLEELSVNEVLDGFGVEAKLAPYEQQMLRDDLRTLIQQQEFAEMAYMVVRG